MQPKPIPFLGKNAFSLVELAIVLVILGLLVGGVLSGQALIKSAAHRKVLVDYDNYRSAMHAFLDKYQCLPGDCPNFSSFMPGEPNGNGDLQLLSDEKCTIWRHMSLAGLITGNYANDCYGGYMVAGENGPRMSTSSEDYFHAAYVGDQANGNHVFGAGSYGNVFYTYKQCKNSQGCGYPVFTAIDAFSLDAKADDGMPATGSVRAMMNNELCFPDPVFHGNQPYNVSLPDRNCILVLITGL